MNEFILRVSSLKVKNNEQRAEIGIGITLILLLQAFGRAVTRLVLWLGFYFLILVKLMTK